MPTVRWFPRGPEYRYYFSCFERFGMAKQTQRYKKFILMQMSIMSRKRRNGQLTSNDRRRGNIIMLCCMRCIMRINAHIRKKEIKTFYPPEGVIQYCVESTFWDNAIIMAFSMLCSDMGNKSSFISWMKCS